MSKTVVLAYPQTKATKNKSGRYPYLHKLNQYIASDQISSSTIMGLAQEVYDTADEFGHDTVHYDGFHNAIISYLKLKRIIPFEWEIEDVAHNIPRETMINHIADLIRDSINNIYIHKVWPMANGNKTYTPHPLFSLHNICNESLLVGVFPSRDNYEIKSLRHQAEFLSSICIFEDRNIFSE